MDVDRRRDGVCKYMDPTPGRPQQQRAHTALSGSLVCCLFHLGLASHRRSWAFLLPCSNQDVRYHVCFMRKPAENAQHATNCIMTRGTCHGLTIMV
jgi:hypothetical protein